MQLTRGELRGELANLCFGFGVTGTGQSQLAICDTDATVVKFIELRDKLIDSAHPAGVGHTFFNSDGGVHAVLAKMGVGGVFHRCGVLSVRHDTGNLYRVTAGSDGK